MDLSKTPEYSTFRVEIDGVIYENGLITWYLGNYLALVIENVSEVPSSYSVELMHETDNLVTAAGVPSCTFIKEGEV